MHSFECRVFQLIFKFLLLFFLRGGGVIFDIHSSQLSIFVQTYTKTITLFSIENQILQQK